MVPEEVDLAKRRAVSEDDEPEKPVAKRQKRHKFKKFAERVKDVSLIYTIIVWMFFGSLQFTNMSFCMRVLKTPGFIFKLLVVLFYIHHIIWHINPGLEDFPNSQPPSQSFMFSKSLISGASLPLYFFILSHLLIPDSFSVYSTG